MKSGSLGIERNENRTRDKDREDCVMMMLEAYTYLFSLGKVISTIKNEIKTKYPELKYKITFHFIIDKYLDKNYNFITDKFDRIIHVNSVSWSNGTLFSAPEKSILWENRRMFRYKVICLLSEEFNNTVQYSNEICKNNLVMFS